MTIATSVIQKMPIFKLFIFDKYPVIQNKAEYIQYWECDVALLNNHDETFCVIKHRDMDLANIENKYFNFDEIYLFIPKYIKEIQNNA